METKQLVWIGMFLGSLVGGAIPMLWGGDLMSETIWSGVGGIAGIWLGYKIANG